VGLGGLFWGGSDDREAINAIQASVDAGSNAIDTAPIYGRGHSERIVGQAIRGRRDKVLILTKCGIRWDVSEGEHHFTIPAPDGSQVTAHRWLSGESILHECEQSLQRLGIDTIDLYQIHTPNGVNPHDEVMSALLRLQQQGKIRHIGVSNYSGAQMDDIRRHGAIVSNQIRYNLVQRDIEKDELPYCRQHNLGVIAYSPMAMGLLTGKVTVDRKFPESDVRSNRPLFSAENRQRVLDALEKVRPIAEGHRCTFGQLAVAWVLHQPGITTALVGARNADQARQNAAAADVKLSADELETIRAAFEGVIQL
jgi:aryl-alcohol dehydrogenase-like predicted oxidoreductase